MPAMPEVFFTAFIECAMWVETDPDDGRPLELCYGLADIHPDTLAILRRECEDFYDQVQEMIVPENLSEKLLKRYTPDEIAGHDFWLTRNQHGAGFWDGDWSEPAGQELTRVSRLYGEVSLYIGGDNMIHADHSIVETD